MQPRREFGALFERELFNRSLDLGQAHFSKILAAAVLSRKFV
jgi:hypothetical protein